jgi:hypothetical protein
MFEKTSSLHGKNKSEKRVKCFVRDQKIIPENMTCQVL